MQYLRVSGWKGPVNERDPHGVVSAFVILATQAIELIKPGAKSDLHNSIQKSRQINVHGRSKR